MVEFDGPLDPLHAQNWPLKKKLPIAATLGYVTLTAAFGSSIFSAAIGSVAEHFHLSREVGILGVSLYVLGFATGMRASVRTSLSFDTNMCRSDRLGAIQRAVRA